jgi:hypothetical protein
LNLGEERVQSLVQGRVKAVMNLLAR